MCWHSMLLPHVLNSTWSAECADSIIELVIGNVLSTTWKQLHAFFVTNSRGCFEARNEITNYRLLYLTLHSHYIWFFNYYNPAMNNKLGGPLQLNSSVVASFPGPAQWRKAGWGLGTRLQVWIINLEVSYPSNSLTLPVWWVLSLLGLWRLLHVSDTGQGDESMLLYVWAERC